MSGKFLLSASDKSFEFFWEILQRCICGELIIICVEFVRKTNCCGQDRHLLSCFLFLSHKDSQVEERERKYHSERDLRLYSTNASAPGDGLDQSEASIGDH